MPQDTAKAEPKIDAEGFARAMQLLRKQIDSQVGWEDYVHLRKLERWGRRCTQLGYATAWIIPNPLSALLLSQGNVTRWTTIAHHLSHRALDRIPGIPSRYTSKRFATGRRRFVDWLDWILPEAWHTEHNLLHHYHTGEAADPDLVEDNARTVRELAAPQIFKYAVVAFYACTWKLSYYAPSTFMQLLEARRRRAGQAPDAAPQHYRDVFWPGRAAGREFWRRCIAPYGLVRFVLIPGLFLGLGPLAATNVFLNTLFAELLANLHSFLIIAPNHAGDDVYRFDSSSRDRAGFYVRQVMGSVNMRSGSELGDFLHGYLNYQIEHHLFPDLPPLKYRQIQPQVQALCQQYGIPYVQQGLLSRVRKLVDIMVGKSSMRRLTDLG